MIKITMQGLQNAKNYQTASRPDKTVVAWASCLDHRDQFETTLCRINRSWIGTECPICDKSRYAAEALVIAQRSRQSAAMLALREAGIPKRFVNKSLDNFDASVDDNARYNLNVCKRYAHNFVNVEAKGISLILCGAPGTGKTHLACAVGNHLIEKGKTVLFIGCMQAIGKIRETWRRDSEDTEREVIERFAALDLLILDEVGVQFGKESEKINLFQIINRRYEENKPTIIIANLTKNELIGYLGERIIDRLGENGGPILPFSWGSYR